jgi:hypothetical protein
VVIHTTETRTLPGYRKGATAPHLTYAPASRKWWQHTDLDVAARALRNLDGGIQTNRDGAWQVEVICYSNKTIADQVGGLWVGSLLPHAYADLAAFCTWAGVPATWPGRAAGSYAAANAPGFRLTPAEWDAFAGVCGHQHVPENDHWDPGAFDWAQLMAAMGGQEGDGPVWTRDLDEAGWRALARAGIAAGGEAAVVDYWVVKGAQRTLAEHQAASASMLPLMLARLARQVDDPEGGSGAIDAEARAAAAKANQTLARIRSVI